MKKLALAVLLALLCSTASYAQRGTYVGVVSGPTFMLYDYTSTGNDLWTAPFLGGAVYGFTLGQDLTENVAFETGFIGYNYNESYRLRGEFGTGISSGIHVHQFPLRFKIGVDLGEPNFRLVTTLGYSLAINRTFGATGSSSRGFPNPRFFPDDTTLSLPRSRDTTNFSVRKNYSLLEAGLGLEWELAHGLIFTANASYFHGFQRVIETEVNYWTENESDQQASIWTNGDYFSLIFGMKYAVSNIWQRKRPKPSVPARLSP